MSYKINIDGKEYKNIKEAAIAHGINPSVAYKRFNRGMSLEDAVTIPQKFRCGVTIKGVHYKNKRDASTAIMEVLRELGMLER